MAKQIQIGKVVKPHGIKGALRCLFFDFDPKFLSKGETLTLRNKAGDHPMIIEEKIGGVNFKVNGVHDRDAADLWRGSEIFIDRALLPETNEDEFYLFDAIGAKAIDPDNENIGEIVGFSDNKAQPLATIETPEGKRFEVPFVKPILVSFDPTERSAIFDLPEGLIDINEG